MTKEQEMFPIKVRTRYTSGLVESLRDWLRKETDVDYPREAVESALSSWVESRYDRIIESLPETLTSPQLAEAQEFRRILEQNYTPAETSAPQIEAATVFTGERPFAKEKLGAMIAYFARHGKNIYKTNLNKLLFYSDLTAYYLNGHGISGATYVNRPYGPVPDQVDRIIEDLAESGIIERVNVPEFGPTAQRITAPRTEEAGELTPDEESLLDWVLETYGDMSPSELSEYSHLEKAYKFTRPLEPIAYEYAKFFKKLPPRGN